MAKLDKLNRRQTYMLNCINWIEGSKQIDATVMSIDFESGAVAVFGKEAVDYRRKLRNMMRRVN